MFLPQPWRAELLLYLARTPNPPPRLRVGIRDGLREPCREQLRRMGEEHSWRDVREKLEARENNQSQDRCVSQFIIKPQSTAFSSFGVFSA